MKVIRQTNMQSPRPFPRVPMFGGGRHTLKSSTTMQSKAHQPMNQIPPFTVRLAACAALLATTCALPAQTWETVDDYQYTPGLTAVSGEIGTDLLGNVYAVGRGTPEVECTHKAVVRGSGDQGATWEPLDDYQETGFHGAHYRAVAASGLPGHLLVGGHIAPAADCVSEGAQAWIIRESFDAGATWSPADDPAPFANDTGGSCADIKVHPSGDVYACGIAPDLGWVVRKRPAGGAFSTVFPQSPSALEAGGQAYQVGFHPNGDVFVVGCVVDSAGSSTWTVRRSSDQGETWDTVDSFRSAEWTSGSAQGIAVTESGTLYVTGWAFYSSRKGSGWRWVVRTSHDGGTTWALSDYTTAGGGVGVAVDANGKPYVCGYGNGNWLVRTLSEVTTIKKGKPVTTLTWITIDSYQLASGQSARANGIATDTVGNIFVSGSAMDGSGVNHWIVRKLSAGQ